MLIEKSVTLDPPGTEKRCKLKERAFLGPWRTRRACGRRRCMERRLLLPLGGRATGVLEERTAVNVVRSEGREMIRCGVSKIIRLRSRMDLR